MQKTRLETILLFYDGHTILSLCHSCTGLTFKTEAPTNSIIKST